MDAVVAGAADSQPPLDIVEAGLPATTAMVYLRRGGGRTALASRASGEILLTQFGVSGLLDTAFLAYGINPFACLAREATSRIHKSLTLQRASFHPAQCSCGQTLR